MKLIFTLIALLTVKAVALAGVDLGAPSSTPYDRYLGPVREVFGTLSKEKPSMQRVQELMSKGRSFRYHMDNPYIPATPAVTAKNREGDCKDKALWLCEQLNDSSVRFVIGKATRNARMSHAWVMWENEGRYWILDCTLKSAPIAADTLSAGSYIPQYSYAKNGSYRHSDSQTGVAAVAAARKNSPVGAGDQK